MQINLPVFEFHINGIIPQVLIRVWILSINFMFIKFIHGFCCRSSFISVAVEYSVLWMNHNELTHLAVAGIWVGFLLGACTSNAAGNILVSLSRAAVLKVRSGDTWGFPRSFRGVRNVKTIFIKMLRCYLPFTFILSQGYSEDREATWYAMMSCSDD